MEQVVPADRQGRPFGVVLLTILLLVYATLGIPHLLDLPGLSAAGLARLVRDPELRASAQAAQSVVAAVAALGLWLRRRWGWVGAMVLAGPTLALEVGLYFRGTPAYLSMAVPTLIALYLNSAAVQRHFFREKDADPRQPGPDERAAA